MRCCRFGTSSMYTIQPCTRLQCHFIQSHIGRVYVCLAVTCHLHFWQNDQDLLCATVVTRGWNGYQNKNQHRKLALEKKILQSLLPGLEPGTFWSWVRHSNHWAIPTPHGWLGQLKALYVHVQWNQYMLRPAVGQTSRYRSGKSGDRICELQPNNHAEKKKPQMSQD